MLILSWDRMHLLSREQACITAGLRLDMAERGWKGLEEWEQVLLSESMSEHTEGRVTVGQ